MPFDRISEQQRNHQRRRSNAIAKNEGREVEIEPDKSYPPPPRTVTLFYQEHLRNRVVRDHHPRRLLGCLVFGGTPLKCHIVASRLTGFIFVKNSESSIHQIHLHPSWLELSLLIIRVTQHLIGEVTRRPKIDDGWMHPPVSEKGISELCSFPLSWSVHLLFFSSSFVV